MEQILAGFVLFGLGIVGWQFLRALKVPFASLFGALFLVGGLRLAGVALPTLSTHWEFVVQAALGFYVGSMVSKDTMLQIKAILLPSLVSMVWVLALAFGGGWLLSTLTALDPLTAVLGSSSGGLPEMTVIALDTHADVSVIVILQILRMALVAVLFPVLLRFWEPDHLSIKEMLALVRQKVTEREESFSENPTTPWIAALAALAGGLLLDASGVPAGGMVGAILATAIIAGLGWTTELHSRLFLDFLLIGIGILAVNSFDAQMAVPDIQWSLMQPLALSIAITIVSSLGLAVVLWKITHWDFATCFLAAAPAGLTVTAALAVQYNKDPMPIFVLHMARLFSLKVGIPIILTFLL